jgi:hypothetical protein
MNNLQTSNLKNYNAVAWGLLSILWGITILFDFVPFGVGLVGTGLILLGANVFLSLNGLPTKGDNTLFGFLALVWGGLELARPILHSILISADLDWVIFAVLLITLGLILIGSKILARSGGNVP